MGEITAISWCDHTFNPWIGCQKAGPACDGCYAEQLMDARFGRVKWGPGQERVRTSPSNWREPVRWNAKAAKDGTRPFVFCASLADVFDNAVDPEWRRDLFDLIRETPRLVYLLLTKRIGNVEKMVEAIPGLLALPSNVAIGATIANQAEYDRDAPKLLAVRDRLYPAFTFGSLEPLLGSVVLDANAPDWIITGGETDQGGHQARPSHPDWFRRLRDDAARLRRVYQHKQNGEWVSVSEVEGPQTAFHEFEDGATVRKVGKHRSGRMIDGIEHDGRPVVAAMA